MWNFLIGMASVFYPSAIHVAKIQEDSAESDFDNILNDWKSVGSYINNAYEAVSRQQN